VCAFNEFLTKQELYRAFQQAYARYPTTTTAIQLDKIGTLHVPNKTGIPSSARKKCSIAIIPNTTATIVRSVFVFISCL